MKTDCKVKPEVLEKLTSCAKAIVLKRRYQMGYPFDQATNLNAFYHWLYETGLYNTTLISVGSPWKESWDMLDVDEFERDAVSFMAEAFGFPHDTYWGFVTNGGTDGNMHGIYFGRKALQGQMAAFKKNENTADSKKCSSDSNIAKDDKTIPPLLYVSAEAHYSVQKLGDVLNIETRVIRALPDGRMDTEDFRRQLDPGRPALIVIAVGGTFKGAIDDQKAISEILKEKPPIAVYRHLDIALFGGYLPFLDSQDAKSIINQLHQHFDSVAVSGHKFLAMNEPCGFFICRKGILEHLHNLTVPYLNCVMPTISCSRSGFDVLKLYWRIFTTGREGFREEAEHVLAMTHLLVSKLNERGIKAYANPWSNTVIFPRPSDEAVHRFCMACSGEFSHVVVMQYFDEPLIDELVEAIGKCQ
ncbi:MAG: pyridoxal-dependent decarboxylase [Thermoguttaceae bacterium]|nr:pyridoxal-dependent decarboxylase [Thermoguttaceae bacterium]